LLNAGGGAESVGGRILDVVEQPGDAAGGNVQAGVGGSVVDEYFAVVFRDPAVAECDVRHVPHPLGPDGAIK